MTIPSPCIGVCSIDPDSGYCKGCFRTVEEVRDWKMADDGWKSELLPLLEERKQDHAPESS